jgi:CheY-like chemotaxis protein
MSILKVLVVEDDPVIATNLEEQLLGFGYAITDVTHNSDTAIHSFKRRIPDLVVLDIVLENSVMDGIEIAEVFNSIQKVPIVYLTASSNIEMRERAKKTNPSYYLLKPYFEKQLEVAIDMAIDTFSSREDELDGLAYVKNGQVYSKNFVFHLEHGVIRNVPAEEVLYCEANKTKMKVYLKEGHSFETTRHLGFYAKTILKHPDFLQAGEAHILNMSFVRDYTHSELNEVKLSTGRKVYLSRGGGQLLRKHLNELSGLKKNTEG